MYRFLLGLVLCLFCLASCVLLTHGQVDCISEDDNNEQLQQCEEDFFCDSDFRCKKCASCENYDPLTSSSCPKSFGECGLCREGYEFHSPGKCVVRYSLGFLFLWVGAGTSILVVVGISSALYYMRKKNNSYCCSVMNPVREGGNLSSIMITPTAPKLHTEALLPSYTAPKSESTKSFLDQQEYELERWQMANPYSNCVRLPPDHHRYKINEGENGDVAIQEDGTEAENILNNNELVPMSQWNNRSEQDGGLLLPVPADQTEHLPLMDTTDREQDNHGMESTDLGLYSNPNSTAPQGDATSDPASQQLIVQIISKISPILNLQGNNNSK